MQTVLKNLQEAIEKLFQWFSVIHLVVNADKCHLLTCSKTVIDICQMPRFRMKKFKLLGINLEGRLNIDCHGNTQIKKAKAITWTQTKDAFL